MVPIRKVMNPELFQGSMGRKGYFEGWYFRVSDSGGGLSAAAIPGVALGRSREDSHAFVQFLSGGKAEYFQYPLDAFRTDSKRFLIEVGDNKFSLDGMRLALGGGRVAGEVTYHNHLLYPKQLFFPGIMGPLGYLPGMECYHAVVSLRHGVSGSLTIGGERVSFDGGSGYIEKDWGRAFPSAYLWAQANRFAQGGAFLFSIADIPMLGRSFRGFFTLLHDGRRLYRFATYNGGKIASLQKAGDTFEGVVTGHGLRLAFSATPGPGGMLKAPSGGLMNREVEESLTGTVAVRLTDKQGNTLFDGRSCCAGIEECGVIPPPRSSPCRTQ